MSNGSPAGDYRMDILEHYGVKGMKWGVRQNRDGVSRKTDREAQKDAREFARAKMFYGEGAGNRRKLIKATVEAKSKKDPSYQKAFDKHLTEQDMSKHASKARGERKRKDVVGGTAKTARGVRHILNGNSQYASATAALLVGGAMYARRSGIDRVVMNAAKTSLADLGKSFQNFKSGRGAMTVDDFLRSMNMEP